MAVSLSNPDPTRPSRVAVARSPVAAEAEARTLRRLEACLRGTRLCTDPAELLERARQHMNVPEDIMPMTPASMREASVLVPIVRREAGPTVLFTRRADHLRQHAGQVSFPGGALEPGDTDATAAALRETHEEIGVEPYHVQVAGWLDPYLTLTGFCVTPVVGLVRDGFDLRPDPDEVAEVFEVPLEYAFSPAHRTIETRTYGGREFSFYRIEYGKHVIWGATAGMLVNLAERVLDE